MKRHSQQRPMLAGNLGYIAGTCTVVPS